MKLYIVFIENIDTIYSNIFTEKHRFPLENKIIGGAAYEEYSDK